MRMFNRIILKIQSSDIAKRLARGTFWTFSGTSLAKIIVLVASIICARILGKDSYGELGIVRSTITMFVTVGIAGLGLTATKYISEFRRETPERIPSIYLIATRFSYILACIISLLIIILAPVIADKTLDSPYLTNDLRFGGILLFFTILNGVQSGVMTGFEDFKHVSINNLFGSIAESLLMCVGAYYYGVTGAIIGFGSGYIVIYVLNRISIKRLFKSENINIRKDLLNRQDLKILYTFSLPAALSSLMVAPVFWSIKSLLVRMEGYGQLAIFDAADQWKIIILFIPTAVGGVVLPILSSLVKSNQTQFWKVLKINIIMNAAIATILTIIIALIGNWIMNLYGSGFDHPLTLIVLCASTIFTSVAMVVGYSIQSRGKVWIGFTFNLAWGCMLIGFTILFLKMGYGALGLSLALLCSYFFHACGQYIYLKYTYPNKNIHE